MADKFQALFEALQATGFPVAYHHFNVADPPASFPFICWMVDYTDDLKADDFNYVGRTNVRIELYYQTPNWEDQEKLERQLQSLDLTFDKEEVWIEQEQIYQMIYESELI